MNRLVQIVRRRIARSERSARAARLSTAKGGESCDESLIALRFGLGLHARASLGTAGVPVDSSSLGIHGIEGAVAPAPARAVTTSLATLLTRHFLRDGEVILLVLKPSLWYITLSCLRVAAAVLIAVIAAHVWLRGHTHFYAEAGIFVVAGRVVWAVLNWMGRLYVLTDQRVVRLSGIFSTEIFECPLRRVARTRLHANIHERLLAVGSIEIIPQDDSRPCGYWQTVARPDQVMDQITSAIRRAKMG